MMLLCEKGVWHGCTAVGPLRWRSCKEGDIIVREGGTSIVGLNDLSDVLKAKQPGDKLPVRFLRKWRELHFELLLQQR